MMKTTMVTPTVCRECGRELDAASAGDAAPAPDDLSICLYCGALSKFDASLRLVPCNVAELEPDTRREVEQKQAIIRHGAKRRRARN